MLKQNGLGPENSDARLIRKSPLSEMTLTNGGKDKPTKETLAKKI